MQNMSFMPTMLDPQMLTKRKREKPIMETKPNVNIGPIWVIGLCVIFHFFAYSFNFQICYSRILQKKKKIIDKAFKSNHNHINQNDYHPKNSIN